MGILDRIGATNYGRTIGARDALSEFMTTLAGVDCLGIPPVSVYQRFNSVGVDVHGQCAVAQGACGYRLGGNIKVDLAKLIPAITPFTASGKVSASLARLPTSAILMYRLQSERTALNGVTQPLALAQLDGINWTFKSGANLTVGVKVQPFKSLGSLPLDIDLTLQAGAAYTYLGTKLVASKTHHFSRANTKALAEEVDKIFAVEIKKTLATILANEESEASAIAKEAALHVGKTSLKKIAKATKDDLKAIGKSALNELRQGNGFEYLAAGFATGGVGLIADKAVYDAYLRRKDGKLDGQIHDLRLALGDKFLALSDAEQTGAKGKGLRKAMERLTELRDAFLHERMFGGGSNPDAGDVPVVNDALLSRTDQTALTLTSNEYGGNLAATGKVNLGPMDTTAKKTADLMGQKLDFRFQVRGANDMIMVQDTHANFMQMTTKLAISGALATTGVKKLDAKLKKNHAPAAVQTPGAPALFGGRRFGALRYRAATVYMKNDGAHKRTAVPGISGVSMGVSVRAARLVSYAQNVKALIKSDSPDNDIREFETWVCLHLGCKPL